MATKPPEWIRTGEESLVFGPEGPGGYVTKITGLQSIRPSTDAISAPSQVMSRLRMKAMSERASGLPKIHMIRAVMINGKPYLLTIHDNVHGEKPNASYPLAFHFGQGIPSTFDDIKMRNVIKAGGQYNLVDAFIWKDKRLQQMRPECRGGNCACNWQDFAKNFPQMGEIPAGYVVLELLKATYPPSKHPWVRQLEKEAKGTRKLH